MMLPVLLIEDDPDIRTLAELALNMDGIATVSCPNGRSGLDALAERSFGLVVLDVMMPDMSGFDVLSEIQKRWGKDAPPVALFTARPEDTTAREALGQSIVQILKKPFEPQELAMRVRQCMRSDRV